MLEFVQILRCRQHVEFGGSRLPPSGTHPLTHSPTHPSPHTPAHLHPHSPTHSRSRYNRFLILQVFLKYWHVEKLNIMMTEASKQIISCQKFWRGAAARLKYQRFVKLMRQVEEFAKIINDIANIIDSRQADLKKEDEDKHVTIILSLIFHCCKQFEPFSLFKLAPAYCYYCTSLHCNAPQ